MKEAIGAYRNVTATDEFKEIERLRSRARHNEASALYHARLEGRAEGEAKGRAEGRAKGEELERAKWLNVIEEKNALISKLLAQPETNK